jgi:Ca2+/Na+ antiporter
VANITLVLGIVLVLSDIDVDFTIISTLVGFSILVPLATLALLRRGRIAVWHSVALLVVYATFITTLYGSAAIT